MITYTLNEDIRVRVDWTGRLTPPVESYIVTYSIYAYKKNNYQIPIDGEYETIPFFVGSAYIPAGQTYLDLCINDIVGFQRWIPKFIHKEANDGHLGNTGDTALKTDDWYNKFKIVVTDLPDLGGMLYTTTFDNAEWDTIDGKWICGQAGYSHSNDGVQVTARTTGAYTTSRTSFPNVSKVIVTYCTNTSTGTGNVEMTIGNTTKTLAVTRSGGRTKRTLTFDFPTKPSGIVKLLVNCSVNSIYISNINIYYDESEEGNITFADKEFCVGLWYDYSNQILTENRYALPDIESGVSSFTNCLEGHTDTSAALLPHIPFIKTYNYGFGLVFYPTKGFINSEAIPSGNGRTIALNGQGFGTYGEPNTSYYLEYPTINYIYRPLAILMQSFINTGASGRKTLVVQSQTQTREIAEIDICPARYYLEWIDRKGGIQSQPFNGTAKFSEDFARVQIQSGMGHKRNVSLQDTIKWTINTDWIDENLYPYYESIYTSPYLLLYDTKTDKSFNVILTDKGYTEKTKKNQKKLFNMTLNVTADKIQNMYY